MDANAKREIAITQAEAEKLQRAGAKVTIKTRDDLIEATAFLTKVKQFNKAIATKKKAIVGPLRLAIKEVNDLFADAETRGSMVESNIKNAMLEYQQKLDKAALKKTAKLEEQVDSGAMDIGTATGKLSKIEQAPTSLKTEEGSVQFRTVRKVRIKEYGLLPTSYFMRPSVLEAVQREVAYDVLKLHKPVPAGAEAYEEKIVAGSSS